MPSESRQDPDSCANASGRASADPKEWGPHGWQFLRACAIACDSGSSEAYHRFFSLLPEVLPCAACRSHSRDYLLQCPLDLQDLPRWVDTFEATVAKRVKHRRPPSLLGIWVVLLLVIGGVALSLACCTPNRGKMR